MKLDFIKIASIIKTHGYKGDLVLKIDSNISFSQFNKCLKEGNAIFISKDGIPVPFFISAGSLDIINEDIIQLKLDEVNELERAKHFINNNVFLTVDCIEKESDSNYSPLNWIDFKVLDKNHGFIGSVINFNEDIPKNPLLIIQNKGKELMIPVNGDLITSIDAEKKEIHTYLPDGYLDLYL